MLELRVLCLGVHGTLRVGGAGAGAGATVFLRKDQEEKVSGWWFLWT